MLKIENHHGKHTTTVKQQPSDITTQKADQYHEFSVMQCYSMLVKCYSMLPWLMSVHFQEEISCRDTDECYEVLYSSLYQIWTFQN